MPRDEGDSKAEVEMQQKNDSQAIELVMSPDGSDEELEELEEIGSTHAVPWLPYLLKHLIIMILGGGVLAVPIIVMTTTGRVDFVKAIHQNDPAGADHEAYRAVRFFSWASAMVFIVTFVSFIVSILPRFVIHVTRILSIGKLELVKQYLEFYTALVTTIKVAFSVAISFGLWCFSFPHSVEWDPSVHAQDWSMVFFRILLCLVILVSFITLEKIFLQLIAVRFHRTAYRQRLGEANYATFVLDSLNKARRRGTQPPAKRNDDANNTRISFVASKGMQELGSSVRNMSSNNVKPKTAYTSIYNNLNKNVFDRRYDDNTDLHSRNEAQKLARKLFASLQGHRNYLKVQDFYPLFSTQDEANKAFEYFDKDGNGDISRREMREQIMKIYKERKDLTLALRDTSQAVGKLDSILLIIFVIISGFTSSVVFGKDLYATLIPFGTFFLGLSFIFGDSAKELFQSIIFLFVMHPYDAGDRVYIESDNLLVEKVGLLGTKFTHINGQSTYIPHMILMKKIIYNIRRSTSQAEQIDFQIDFDTPKEKIFALKERINQYLFEEESRDFYSEILMGLSEIIDSNKLNMFFWLEYKGNWQNGGKRWARKTRFMIALREICKDLDMQYSLLPQKIEHLNPPPYNMPPHTH
ncbi:hypothetical protein DSO57_1005549 [Entomophthora muscae]|uniref:Uncharacterized protein n=1 Tax=Entomophthora muscae TaxID=34485 RepID=A0ACC2TJ67_9FUNG|nr:hypothetical protein DSO57_1005549 [Entomophthora muscae]